MVWPWTLTFWLKNVIRSSVSQDASSFGILLFTTAGQWLPSLGRHQWQKFGENLSIDTGDIVETWKSGMHSVMPRPWTLTFWPQNLISSSLSRDAPVTKVWRKSVSRYWRYRGNIKHTTWITDGRTDGQWHGRTTRKHIDSAGAYRRRRLNKQNMHCMYTHSYYTASTCQISLHIQWHHNVMCVRMSKCLLVFNRATIYYSHRSYRS